MRRSGFVCGVLSVAALSLTLSVYPAQAEMYVAGQAGLTVPNDFSNVEGTGSGAGVSISDVSLKNSIMYGAKLGYYFESMKWLGVETEVFNTTPHVKQQDVTASFGGASQTGNLTGQYVRVLTWAPINVVVRYQMGQLEPYAGVGLGLFFARTKDAATGETSSSNARPGLNTQVGVRYLVTKNFSMFTEWKYNRVSLNFDESSPTQAAGGIKGDYSAHHFVFGVGYHF